jgi:glycosyltransferase
MKSERSALRSDPLMKISVLTTTFNSARTLRRTLDSFCSQDWPDREMLVLDGASSDATQEIAKAYRSENIFLFSKPDKGMYDALNTAFRLFTGDAAGVLNSDDAYADATVLSKIAEALEEADLTHGNLHFVDKSGRIVRKWQAEERPRKGFRAGWMPAHPTFYVRRKVIEAIGPFDTSLQTAADYDWMLRAIETQDFKLKRIDSVLINMAVGGRSTRNLAAYIHHNLESLSARQRWLGSGPVDLALLMKPARKIMQFAARPPARSA